jgi:hypothetical protein
MMCDVWGERAPQRAETDRQAGRPGHARQADINMVCNGTLTFSSRSTLTRLTRVLVALALRRQNKKAPATEDEKPESSILLVAYSVQVEGILVLYCILD